MPSTTLAQTDESSSGGVWGWVTNGFDTAVSNGVGFFVELGNSLWWPNSSGPDAVVDAGNAIVNTGVNTVVTTGNTLWWPNSSGPTVVSNIVDTVVVNPIVELVVAIVNNWPGNTDLGEPAGGDASTQGGPTQLTPQNPTGTNNTHTVTSDTFIVMHADGTFTEYDRNGNVVETYDAEGRARGGGGSGVSIPGASRGTVGNPFSDGTDSTDAASDNDEISPFANPYLFEYDPNSTNNNPSGDGALEQ